MKLTKLFVLECNTIIHHKYFLFDHMTYLFFSIHTLDINQEMLCEIHCQSSYSKLGDKNILTLNYTLSKAPLIMFSQLISYHLYLMTTPPPR